MAELLSWLCVGPFQGKKANFFNRRAGSVVAGGLNVPRTARLELATEDPAAATITPLDRFLKVTFRDAPLFQGKIMVPDYRGENAEQDPDSVTVSAVDPSFSLDRRSTRKLRRHFVDTPGPGVIVVTQYPFSDLMWKYVLIANPTPDELDSGIPTHGIVRGAIPSPDPLVTAADYSDGTHVLQVLNDLSSKTNGPDFELEPIEATDGSMARFNVYYPRQGTDRSASVVLEYGLGTENVHSLDYQLSGNEVCNRFTAVGKANKKGNKAPAWVEDSLESQQKYGILQDTATFSGIRNIDFLHQFARDQVYARAFPVEFADVVLIDDGTLTPQFGPYADFWMGDTVTLRSARPAVDTKMRVTDWEITELEEGAAQIKLTMADDTPVGGLTGSETTVFVGGQ